MSEAREVVFSRLSGLEAGSDQTGNGGAERAPAAGAEEDEVQKARVEAGRVWYEKYCVPCHGAGGAPGKAVARAAPRPSVTVPRLPVDFPSPLLLIDGAVLRPLSVSTRARATLVRSRRHALHGTTG